MRFADVEAGISSGDVFLFRGRRWYSWLIRFWSQSVYSHVGLAYRLKVNGHSRVCIFEAIHGQGVRLHPMDQYLVECASERCPVDWYAIDDPTVDREKVADHCFGEWARTYAPIRQFWWSFGLGRFIRRLLGKPVDLKAGEFCSWLAAAALQAGGCHCDEVDADVSNPALTDPGTIARYPCLQRRGTITP